MRVQHPEGLARVEKGQNKHKSYKIPYIPRIMDKKYVSFDVEASGRTPGRYSMLSLGACIVGEREKTFYREIKPISRKYVSEAMRIGCLGLRCLDDLRHLGKYNPKSNNFSPLKVLEVLDERGDLPEKVMKDYAEWIIANTKGFKPIEAAAPIKFDSMFTTYYFDNFYNEENPFGHSGEDMNSFYRGIVKNVNASMEDLALRDERGLPHNALEDAIQQAKEFEEVLKMIKSV